MQQLKMYIINDQPNTCPVCGARTLEMGSFFHTNGHYCVDICIYERCGHLLMFCADEEFNKQMKIY